MTKLFLALILGLMSLTALRAEDSIIEHQIRLCESGESILQKLSSITFDVSKQYEIFYLETPSRAYQKNNWSIRFRVKDRKTEVTIKKRIQESLAPKNIPDLKCEYDSHGNVKEYSCKIDSEIDTQTFKNIIDHKLDWVDVLSKNQKLLLNHFNGQYSGALIYGSFLSNRFKWQEGNFSEITLDLVVLKSNDKHTFNEISVRYLESDQKDKSSQFEKIVKTHGLHQCQDQLDWPVNKFDLFDVLN